MFMHYAYIKELILHLYNTQLFSKLNIKQSIHNSQFTYKSFRLTLEQPKCMIKEKNKRNRFYNDGT